MKTGLYRFNSVPGGPVSFAWGGKGFAWFDDPAWQAEIHRAGSHPDGNWSGPVVSGAWEPKAGDFEDLSFVGSESEGIHARDRERFAKLVTFQALAARVGFDVSAWTEPERCESAGKWAVERARCQCGKGDCHSRKVA